MRALQALRVSLPGSSAGTGWRRILAIVGLTTLAVVGPAATAYATDQIVSEHPTSASESADRGLLVRAQLSSQRLYPGARQDLSLLVTNRSAHPVTTTSVHHLDTIVTGSAGECGAADFSMTRTSATSTLIPAGETRTLVLPGALAMKHSAGDGCQGVTLRLVMKVDAR
jgi:hypothetical protein